MRSFTIKSKIASSAFFCIALMIVVSTANSEKNETESILILPIQASLKVLEKRLNSEIPNTLADINEPNNVCVEAQWLKTKGIPKCHMQGIKIYCEDTWINTQTTPEIRCDIKGWVRRNGRISVSGKGSTLNFAFPIKAQVSAEAGIRQTADAAATIYVSATPRINHDWSIAVDFASHFSWSQRPTLKLFGLIEVTIGSKVEPKLREKMDEFFKGIPGILAKLKLREKVAATWSEVQNPIKVNNAPDIYLLFIPKGVAYSGFNIENDILKTALCVTGATQITIGKPINPIEKTELASLGSIPYQDGKFSFTLPMSVSYDELLVIAKEKYPDGYTAELGYDTIKGMIKISNPGIKKGDDGKLYLTANINLDNRSNWLKVIDIFNWFDINGVITFKGVPRVDISTRTLLIDRLEYDSSTNSKLFDALVDVAGIKLIRDHLTSQIAFAYGPKIDAGIAEANRALNITTKEGVKVSATLQSAALENLKINDKDILIDTKLSGTANASIGL